MTNEEFVEYVTRKTTRRIEFDTKQVPLFEKSVVYMALSANACLYVGMSAHGMCRAFSRDHHVLKYIWNDVVKLEVYETETMQDARDLEAMMIQEFKPLHNDRQCIRAIDQTRGRTGITNIIAHCQA